MQELVEAREREIRALRDQLAIERSKFERLSGDMAVRTLEAARVLPMSPIASARRAPAQEVRMRTRSLDGGECTTGGEG